MGYLPSITPFILQRLSTMDAASSKNALCTDISSYLCHCFYDLYKNVPLLRDTASHICGPLIDWIEDWDKISRVRYLGTMLFIQDLYYIR